MKNLFRTSHDHRVVPCSQWLLSIEHLNSIALIASLGMLPEHTVEAYQLAVQQGADVIECDLAVTKVGA